MNLIILNKAKAIIRERHREAEERYAYELSKIDKNPLYIKADRDIRTNTLAISRALCNDQDTAELECVNIKLISDFNKIKVELGAPESCYFCTKCNDKGSLDNGTNCSCLTQIYYQLSRELSGVIELPHFTFADNQVATLNCVQKDNLTKLYTSMNKFTANFPNTAYNNILLIGQVGVGKSCLLSAVANDIIMRGFSVQYLSAFALSNLFLKYHTSDAKTRHQYLDSLLTADLLIIDDLGTEPILKNITLEYLDCVLDERVRKHTMISTNLSVADLNARYKERIVSRLTNNKTNVIQLNGTDLRIKK